MCVDEVQEFKMYIFFQNNQYLGSYYLTGSDDDPVLGKREARYTAFNYTFHWLDNWQRIPDTTTS